MRRTTSSSAGSPVPEGRRLFGRMTVLENLELGAFQRNDKREIAADMTGSSSCSRASRSAAQKAGTLSGGEQQMWRWGGR